ncbi:hypothetical protein FRC10_003328 [Ceratobasidium sp. 414]|nr:hypothetical protein FRC10_003328 [Ceratobasidium sp. 414]
MFRGLLEEPGHTIKQLFRSRSRSPGFSMSGVNQPATHCPAPTTANATTTVLPNSPNSQPLLETNLALGVSMPTLLVTQPPGETHLSNPEPQETYRPQPSGIPTGAHNATGPSLDTSTVNKLLRMHANQLIYAYPSDIRTTDLHQPLAVGSDASAQALIPGDPAANLSVSVPGSKPGGLPSNSVGVLRTKDTAAAALKTSLYGLRKCMNVIPIFGSVADILVDCIDNIPTAAKNHKDFEELASNIIAATKGLEGHLGRLTTGQMSTAVVNVIEELTKQVNYIREKQGRNIARRYIDVEQDIEDLMRSYRRVETLFRQLQYALTSRKSDAILSVWKTTNESLSVASEQTTDTRLAKLDPSQKARYDSAAALKLRRGGCTPNTRQLVLQGLRDWASDPYGAKVYWMNGMAGTGKTTIAYSLCGQLESANQLAASFFCSRSLSDCRDVTQIVPTIAYQLARFCRPFQDALCRVLGNDPDIGTRGVATQFEKLIRDPLQEVVDMLPSGLLVVVIDALDECSNRADASLLLDAILRFAEDLTIKFFVTCRPDGDSLKKMSSSSSTHYSLYHLHDIERALVQADIETYLNVELQATHTGTDEIKRLAEQFGGLFIYASTLVRYVKSKNLSADPQKRLNTIFSMTPSSNGKAYEPLDTLYNDILSAALDDGALEPWERGNIKLVLDTVVCAKEPLTISGLACLLQLESANHAQRAIEPLRPVLLVNERNRLVSVLNASFLDYMRNPSRSGRFYCDEANHSELLAKRCFEMMRDNLRSNMCNQGPPPVAGEDVPDQPNRIDDAIPSHLFYACRYWSDHLNQAADGGELLALLDDFLSHRVLLWTEVMNLKKSMRAGGQILSKAYAWITVVEAGSSEGTSQIYVSVLATWEKTDPMWVHYGKHIPE